MFMASLAGLIALPLMLLSVLLPEMCIRDRS